SILHLSIVDYEVNIPTTTDKLTIFGDAIRVLNQLEFESQESKETNEKLPKEIKTLKLWKLIQKNIHTFASGE
nr:transcription factor bHLH104-like [Tanacetum cinerariifolium]